MPFSSLQVVTDEAIPEFVLGTSLYPTIACVNHSCDPNARIRFDPESDPDAADEGSGDAGDGASSF